MCAGAAGSNRNCRWKLFDSEKQEYKWAKLGCGNYASTHFGTSLPEVVQIKKNEDETFTLTVEAVCDMIISKSDITIEWTTLMGNTETTKEDQLAITDISISEDGEIFSQRKVNFVNKGIEIVVDTINRNN